MQNKNLGYTADGHKIDVDYEYERFPVGDYSQNQKTVMIDVNWNSQVAPAEYMRFKWENKEGKAQELILSREELQTILFLLAPSEQETMYLRGNTEQLKRNRHEFHVKAQRNIRKGEDIIINKYITK